MQNKSRRSHRKSRNGCQSCKRRKVKCDEGRPSCSACSKLDFACQYSLSGYPSLSPLPENIPDSNVSTPASVATLTSHPSFSHDPNYGILDLELLHFYSTITCFTISNLAERQQVWQQTIPRLAFSHHFLLQNLLAVTALHLARVTPKRAQELRLKASEYYASAVQEFHGVVAQVTYGNYHAAFVCAVFVFMYAWNSSDKKCGVFLAGESIENGGGFAVEWVRLLRGATKFFREVSWEEVSKDGPLAKLFCLWDPEATLDVEPCAEGVAKLERLKQIWTPASDSLSVDEANVLGEALRVLKETFIAMSSLGDAVDIASACLSWPVIASDLYLRMVTERRPEALILLAHFSLLLNLCGDMWWLEGMSRKLLHEVHSALSDEWRHWIQWPMNELLTSEFKYQSR